MTNVLHALEDGLVCSWNVPASFLQLITRPNIQSEPPTALSRMVGSLRRAGAALPVHRGLLLTPTPDSIVHSFIYFSETLLTQREPVQWALPFAAHSPSSNRSLTVAGVMPKNVANRHSRLHMPARIAAVFNEAFRTATFQRSDISQPQSALAVLVLIVEVAHNKVASAAFAFSAE